MSFSYCINGSTNGNAETVERALFDINDRVYLHPKAANILMTALADNDAQEAEISMSDGTHIIIRRNA